MMLNIQHHANVPVLCIRPYTPFLYSKTEAVLTSTHNLCFEQKCENSKKKSTENFYFYSREKSMFVVWECFRNGNTSL